MNGLNNVLLLMVGVMWISMQMMHYMIGGHPLTHRQKTCRYALHTANYSTTGHREESRRIWEEDYKNMYGSEIKSGDIICKLKFSVYC